MRPFSLIFCVLSLCASQFEKSFLELLSRRFGCRRVSANIVYNEYISDKLHTHMNSTIFETLTNFVKYLGRTGKCVIDETEKVHALLWRACASLARPLVCVVTCVFTPALVRMAAVSFELCLCVWLRLL